MKVVHDPGSLPWNTQNVLLAFCMYISGIPFFDESNPLSNVYDAEILRKLGYERTPIEEAVIIAHAAKQTGTIEYGFKRAIRLGEALEGFKNAEKLLKSSDDPAVHLVAKAAKDFAAGLLSLPEALSMASCFTLKRWRDELKYWEQKRVFSQQRNRNKSTNRIDDAQQLAEKLFLAGEPLAFMATLMDTRAQFLKLQERYPPTIRLRRAGTVNTQDVKLGKGKSGKLSKHPGFAFYTPETENHVRKHLGIPSK